MAQADTDHLDRSADGTSGRAVDAPTEAATEAAAEAAARIAARRTTAPTTGNSAELLSVLYDELRALAERRLGREALPSTLQATALVHEAYLRLIHNPAVTWDGRGHFFASAAESMRRILIDRARRRQAERYGGGRRRVALDLVDPAETTDTLDDATLLALDDALEGLRAEDSELATLVQLRYFAGLTGEQVADVLDISPRTVKRRWAFARAWLADAIRAVE